MHFSFNTTGIVFKDDFNFGLAFLMRAIGIRKLISVGLVHLSFLSLQEIYSI